MSCKHRRTLTLLAAAVLFWSDTSQSAAQSSPLFIESFNRLLADGDTALGVNYKLEGRLSSISGSLLKLKKCSLRFRPSAGEKFAKFRNRKVVEIFGKLEKQRGKTVFVVSHLNYLASELETFRVKKSVIQNGKPQDWYLLAQWIGRRAKFYDDPQLRAPVVEANRKGLELERNNLKDDTPDAVLALAKKSADLKLPDADRMQYVHEAYRIRWGLLRNSKQPKMKEAKIVKLLDDMVGRLPGSSDRLPTPQPDLEKKYHGDPLAVYRSADKTARKKVHRIFYSEVMLASILRVAAADGSNDLEIAKKLEQTLPELHTLAASYRDRGLAYRLKRGDSLTRPEMLELAEIFRRRKQPLEAQQSVAKWLKALETQSRKEGPVGLMRVAEEYIDLLEDKQRAVKLLQEAYALSPEAEQISSRLKQLGFQRHEGRWIPLKQFNAIPEEPLRKAIRVGRVVVGMTAKQVESTLGAPTATTRIVTAGQLSELWIYGERSASRLTVHLLRTTRRSDLKAIRISQVAPR